MSDAEHDELRLLEEVLFARFLTRKARCPLRLPTATSAESMDAAQHWPVFVTCMSVVEAAEAFESWYVRAHPRLIAALVAFCGSVEIAADAADEACMRAMVRWDRVSVMDRPEGWVYRVAINHVKRRLRRARMERVLLARHGPAESLPAPAAEIWDVVGRLPLRQRTAVVLRYVVDMPQAEIADVMGVTRGTVASTLADARRHLGRNLLDESEETSHG